MRGPLSIMQRRDLRQKRMRANKYEPHQNLREQARRLRQLRNGQLAMAVDDGARFMAHGIVPPPQLWVPQAGAQRAPHQPVVLTDRD